MKCIECDCLKKGYFKSRPNAYVCIGVKEPFIVRDVEVECTEYEERRATCVHKKTRADIVRAMSNKELAGFFVDTFPNACWMCQYDGGVSCKKHGCTEDELAEMYEKWLSEEID